MAITEPFTFNASVSTTELSLTGGTSTIQTQTTPGGYAVVLESFSLAQGDVFEIRLYEKVLSGGTQRSYLLATISGPGGADNGLALVVPFPLMHGWDFTIKKTGGTDRTITASIRKVS